MLLRRLYHTPKQVQALMDGIVSIGTSQAALDGQSDGLVSDLYGLTDDGIAIVE